MSFEIERKFKISSQEAGRLKNIFDQDFGAVEPILQVDQLYLFGKRSMAEHVTGEPIVRVRRAGNKAFFTYKHTVLATGNRLEHETEISDPKSMMAALTEMGWTHVLEIHKTRYHYISKQAHFELDRVENLGDYLEIELLRAEDDTSGEQKIIKIAEQLGLSVDTMERRSYAALLEDRL